MREWCTGIGEVHSVAVITDRETGRSRGFGFIEMDDADAAKAIAARLRTGTVWINEWHMLSERAQFGGYKQSGIGREFGSDGLNEYTEVKTLYVDDAKTRDAKPWYDMLVARPKEGA